MHDLPPEADRDMSADVHRIMVERIRALMVVRKLSARKLSQAAKQGDTAVADILSGKVQNPSIPVVKALAEQLDCDAAYLFGDQDSLRLMSYSTLQVEPILVAGVAEAGAFRAAAVLSPEADHLMRRVLAAPSRHYPKAKRFAYEVRGDSMNAVKPTPILEGMLVFCVDMIDTGLEIESGRIYVVRRTLDHGQTFEFTVKRAMVFKDRIELRSESTEPRHAPIVLPHTGETDPSEEVVAIGLVYGWFFSNE